MKLCRDRPIKAFSRARRNTLLEGRGEVVA